ncbi:MAG: hypothetical protein CMM45_04700 [Rhodospirillaceae bacterium]|nr:hypothetical protein [Rhodospirillaceae bacterium]|tara:strand:+ start:275 stop:505 length:231 start_codon:yes stop_codon:yes gene_type:complete
MIELLRTNDPVLISFVQATLADAGIEALVLDTHASILEGSASAIPRRIMIMDEDLETAKQILKTRGAELNDVRILD